MSQLPFLARVYIWLLAAAAALILVWALPQLPSDAAWLLTLGFYSAAIAISDLFPIVTLRGQAEATMSMALALASAVLFGPAFAATATFLGTFAAELRREREWYRKLFNISQLTLAVTLVGLLYDAMADPDPVLLNSIQDLIAIVIAGLILFLINTALVSVAIALAEKTSALTIWRMAFRDVSLNQLATIPLGALIALLWQANPLAIVLAFLPLLVVRFSMAQVVELKEQTKQTLFALADAIDARDPYTFQHSQRVAKYAEMIAKEMNLPYDEMDVLVASARIHDLGKIGMPDRLLLKPGAFTPEERQEFQRHVEVGEKIMENLPLFGMGREIIEDHHEWFNGSGYPRSKKGEEIPLGARILSVADAFDAMTSDRPYRKARTREEAIAELIRFSGTQFAPQVVEALIKALYPAETPERAQALAALQPQWAGSSSGGSTG